MNKIENEIKYIKVRNKIILELENLMSEKEYIKVEPDYFESYDWFTSNNERLDPKKLVKIVGPSGDVKLLRPDVTTNIIKQLSPYWDSTSNLKLYYNATTFRQKANTISQSKQFGIEWIGDPTISCEIETVKLILEIFSRFNSEFILSIGNQKLLDQLFIDYTLERQSLIKKAISKRDNEAYSILTEADDNILVKNLLQLSGNIEGLLKQLRQYNQTKLTLEYIDFLEVLKRSLSDKELQKINIDLALLTEFDYYCGILFQGYLKNVSRPILSGGRYDKLTANFGVEIPAVGASFDLKEFIREANNE